MDLIRPHFSPPVSAAPPLGAVPVAFTKADDEDEDEEGDLPGLTNYQRLLIGAIVVGGVLASRGKIKPSQAMRILKYAGGSLVGTGGVGLVTHGGHGRDSAAVPPHAPPLRGGPLPPLPGPPVGTDPVKAAAKSIILGAYSAVIRANLTGHISDGNALHLADTGTQLLSPRGRVGPRLVPDAVAALAGAVPADALPHPPTAYSAIRKVLTGTGLIYLQTGEQGVGDWNVPAVFGGMGDVMLGDPKRIVSNLTREAARRAEGVAKGLVAQTGDP